MTNMKYLWTILICIFIFLGGCNSDDVDADSDAFIPGAGDEDYTVKDYATDFKMWEFNEKPFADADKIGVGDRNMCWAASAANMLTWAGWAADEDDTFDIFRSYFEDKPNYVYNAFSYYFSTFETGVSVKMVAVSETQSHLLLDFIVSSVHEGSAVAIMITNSQKKVRHFLTIYGYQYFVDEDNFILYYTDSDDGLHQIRQFKIYWNDVRSRWECQDFYRNYYLDYVISLARR